MLSTRPERQQIINWIKVTIQAGATAQGACETLGLSARTYQRWCKQAEDKRVTAQKAEPKNKLSKVEKDKIIAYCISDEFIHLPPGQIVPILADRHIYLASESSFYRVLKEQGMLKHRGRAKPRKVTKKPTTHIAKGANEVWSWDITYLPGPVKGTYYYLYLIMDIYSRKVVAYEVHDRESAELAAVLIEQAVIKEQCHLRPLVLHSDNGSPMKAQTMLEKLYQLGITPSRGRPRVSNDNPFSESLFRTLKYGPTWPNRGFKTLQASRVWVKGFVDHYNLKHEHSGT